MNIGIIDADLIGRSRHRFPNLACMKIAGWHKEQNDSVELLLNYESIDKYDLVYISKVFTDTKVPNGVLEFKNVKYGGTGFFYDKAESLPCYIEHCMPYYDLYKDFIENKIESGAKAKEFDEYTKYSIGFTTRGCFRKCGFCVNKKYDRVFMHSPLSEFVDEKRPYICLLDDNVLGHPKSKEIFESLNATGKRFKYKQGLDERLLNKSKIEMLLNSNYIGDITFAFDSIDDKDIIEKKLKLWRELDNKKVLKFYVLCGYDKENKYDDKFWIKDIADTFERIKILMKYKCVPYIMRFNKYEESKYRGMYITLARWCNQASFFKKKSLYEFAEANGLKSSSMRYLKEFEMDNKDIADQYYHIKFNQDQEIIKEKAKLGNEEVEQFKWSI